MFHIQGQRIWKLLLCVLLLLVVGVVTQHSVSSRSDCSKNEYWSDGLCCDKCAPGYKLIRKCSSGLASQCEKCSDGTFLEKMNYFPNCFRCEKCTKQHAVVISPCTPQKNTVCGCQSGYRKKFFDSISWECVPLKRKPNGKQNGRRFFHSNCVTVSLEHDPHMNNNLWQKSQNIWNLSLDLQLN